MGRFEKIKSAVVKAVVDISSAVRKAIDLRDCFVFGGLGIMGYGLYLLRPWIAFTVCGAIILAIGIFIGRGKG